MTKSRDGAKIIPFKKKAAAKKAAKAKKPPRPNREKAWEDYHGLVKWVASSIASKCRQFVTTEDLISVGSIGLLKAMDMYDPNKKAQFRTYAVIKIRGEILDYIRKNYPRPVSQQIKAREFVQTREQLSTKLKREPTIDEIAAALEVTIEEAHEMGDMVKQVQFVDWESVAEKGKGGPVDYTTLAQQNMSVLAQISRKELREQFNEILASMPQKVQEVLTCLYFEDMSQIEVSEKMELSPSRVSQLHSEGIAILQEKLKNQLVADALQVA